MSETPALGQLDKPRSCVICAKRKVRCDKQFPCSRCQHAGIQCILPSIDPRPRYARNFAPASNSDAGATSTPSPPAGMAVDKIADRLKLLERLVKDLSGELEQARAASTAATSQSGSYASKESSTDAVATSAAIPQQGRLVVDDSNRVRYVSSGFWSRVDHELDSLKEDTRSYEKDEASPAFDGDQPRSKPSLPATEADRPPLDRHAFLLKHNMSPANHDTSAFFPMASQIPYILEVYSERVHFIVGLPHMSSFKKRLQKRRSGRVEDFSPSEEALAFAVFYAALCSLDDDEVAGSFNVSKEELTLKYRMGLEHALAKADFLNDPSVILVEAFVIFLGLARRHDSPKYVWMMTGLVLRMAHYLGIHHDGAGSKHITPFHTEIQRRIWWNLCVLDARGTEDQGTELSIAHGSYSTKFPLNIYDSDIWPEMEQPPREREGLSDINMLRICSHITRNVQGLVAAGATATVHDHHHRLSNLTRDFEREYLSVAVESRDRGYLAATGWMRLALGRLTLLAFFPMLYNSPGVFSSIEIRTKLLVAAIEVAEYNHALNSDASCQPWRWVYQTMQHWHAVIYLLIEICRRPWSPSIERAWTALQSPWLVPDRASTDKNFDVWVPLRRLMARARKRRVDEITRLQSDPDAAAKIEQEDQQQIPVPSSSIVFPAYFDHEGFRRRWRYLVRPITTANTDTLSGIGSALSDARHPSHTDGRAHSSADGSNMHGLTPQLYENQPSFAVTPESGIDSAASVPWLGDSMDLSDCNNLDTFLGVDTEMEFGDVVGDGDALDFDWNGWYESSKGVL